MDWNGYVADVAKGDTQDQIGRRIGVSGASVSRWKTSGPRPLTAAAFARAYGRPVLEAFVAAGFLSADEAGEMPAARPSLDDLSDVDLLDEVRKRMEARHASQAEDQTSSGEDVQGARDRTPMTAEQQQAALDDTPVQDLLGLAADKDRE